MPVNGGLLKAEALAIAKELKLNDFTASNGWLDSSSTRHQLRFSTLHGESADVENVCNQWRDQLPRLCAGYALEDIWNVDEIGIFFRSVPNKSFIHDGEVPNGTKAQTLRKDSLYNCVAVPPVKKKNPDHWEK